MLMQHMRVVSTKKSGATRFSGVALVTSGDPSRLTGGYLYNRYMLAALENAGLPVTQITLPDNSPRSTDILRAALLEHRPAVIIVDSIALVPSNSLTGWSRQELGARIIALMHMLPSDVAPRDQQHSLRLLQSRLLSAADHVISVSQDLRQKLIGAGAGPDRITTIMPGKDGVPSHQRRSPRRGGNRFLCVANWSPTKGIHLVVEAMALAGINLQVDFVGEERDSDYVRYVHSLVHRYHLTWQVRTHGPQPPQRLADYYKAADVFVLPSRYEGFGTVYAEAMSFGLPVIACTTGCLPWLVEDGCGILVPPDDVRALSEAMQVLGSDSGMQRSMGERAARRSLRLPTWQESSEKFCNVVRQLVQGAGCDTIPSRNSRTQRRTG